MALSEGEKKAMEGLCTCTAQAPRGLSSCREKRALGWRESGPEMYVTGVLCLESLKRGVGWGDFFLFEDVLPEYSHLTQHFDLDISEMLNRLE